MSRHIVLTQSLARSAALDAGNRSMRAGGRRAWSDVDHAVACAEFDRLWPAERDLAKLEANA